MLSIDPTSLSPGAIGVGRAYLTNIQRLNATSAALASGTRSLGFGTIDPAPLITASNLRMVLAALDAESRAVQRVDYAANVADTALGEIHDRLADAEALAIANSNDGLSSDERAANQMEIDAILSSIDSLAGSTAFAGQSLLDGSATFTVANETISLDSAATADLGAVDVQGGSYTLADVAGGGALDTTHDVAGALQAIQAARGDISRMRSELGSFATHTIDARLGTLSVTIEAMQASRSRIADTDYAASTADFARLMVLSEAGLSAMQVEHANRYHLLDLLRGS